MKFCPKCSQTKSKLEFYKNKAQKDGLGTQCKTCDKESKREYYVLNKEEIAEREAKYYRENKEKKEDKLKYQSKWYRENKEKIKEQRAKYFSENKEKYLVASSKRRASKLKASPVWADQEQIRLIYAYRAFIEKSTGIKHHVDHIIPLQNDYVCGLHNEFNLRVVPAEENLRKKNKFVDEPDFIHPDINNFSLMTVKTQLELAVYQRNLNMESV